MCNFEFFLTQISYYIFIARKKFSFRCEPINFETNSMEMCMAYVTYSYFILKLMDYLDTVFFILRKKWAHVSFLHVYHHLMISVGSYILVLYAPGMKILLLQRLNLLSTFSYYFNLVSVFF